jgi:hypothetical protein
MTDIFYTLCCIVLSWTKNGKQAIPNVKNIVNFPSNKNSEPKIKCLLLDNSEMKLKYNKYNFQYSCIGYLLEKINFDSSEFINNSDLSFSFNKNDWNITGIYFENTIYFYAIHEKKGYVCGNLNERLYGKNIVSIISFYKDVIG